MTTQIAKNWSKLSRSEKLEIVETGIVMCDTSEGFLMLRLWSKDNSITAHIQNKLDNHLCEESVSQSTLVSFFGENYNFQEEDAEVILTWMENQI
jgi:hypothetical protein